MFKPQELKELLTAKEFKPFAIYTSDNARYEITNHDMMMVSQNAVEIGVGMDDKGIAERFVRCAIIHITRIEQLQAA